MAKNYYPEEFRRKAVDLYESTPEQTMQEIATDLGISRSALDTWVAKYETPASTSTTAPAGDGQPTGEEELVRLRSEVQRLKAETQKLTTERDILRKAAKYFAGETNW